LAFAEAYFRFGDNFFPAWEGVRPPSDPGIEDFRSVRAFGLQYHLDTRFPYWNPEKGYALDANGELGVRLAGGAPYQRLSAQAAAVRRLPDHWGVLSDFRAAGRLAGGYGSPDDAWHFRLGGPMGLRGQRSEDTRGNAYWLASAELRFPLLAGVEYPVADNLATWKSLYGSAFYDVGEMWLAGDSYGVDHAVGVGLYFDVGVLSFVERVGLRLELGHSLRNGANVLWFGMHRAF
jgi:outer membrane protein assembly factor BamA